MNRPSKRAMATVVAALGCWGSQHAIAQAPPSGQDRTYVVPSPQSSGYVSPYPAIDESGAGLGSGQVPPAPIAPGTSPYPGQPGAGAPGSGMPPGGAAGAGTDPAAASTSPYAPTGPGDPGGAGADFSNSFSPGEGGYLGGSGSGTVMIGDQAPVIGRPTPPGRPFQPGPPPNFQHPSANARALAIKGSTAAPWIRGFKISDNMSPIPQDRVFTSFNYYDNLNYALNRGLGSSVVSGIQVYRYQAGFEKTFLQGWASVGVRESINTISSTSRYPAYGGTHTAMGDMNLFSKFILWQDWEDDSAAPAFLGFGYPAQVGGRNGGLISGGLSLNLPTGPGGFAGSPISKSYHDVSIQPFIGYFFSKGDFYLNGFEAIDVPTDPNDVTMIFNDIGMGYYLYRNPNLDTFITAFAPIFETHINIPLNHGGVFNVSDPSGTSTVVDLTLGSNIQFGQRTVLLLGAITPVTGPRPFSVEATALLNVYFGGRRNNRPAPAMAGR